jgi:hypothetical protein
MKKFQILLLIFFLLALPVVFSALCDSTRSYNNELRIQYYDGTWHHCEDVSVSNADSHDLTIAASGPSDYKFCTTYLYSPSLWRIRYYNIHGYIGNINMYDTLGTWDHRGKEGDTSNTYCSCHSGIWTADGGQNQCCGDDAGEDYCSGAYTACYNANYYVNGDDNSYTCGCGGGTWLGLGSDQNCCGDDAQTYLNADNLQSCCAGTAISDDSLCTANNQWVIDATWCADTVVDPSAKNGTILYGDDIACGCDSSGSICDTIDAGAGANGVCASNACDEGEVANVSGTFYSDCSDASVTYGDQCDSSVNSGGTIPTYKADGVCGGTSHGTCYTEYASDTTSSISASSIFGTEANVCDTENTYYCDDVSDGFFLPGDQRCDASDSLCRTCTFGSLTDTEGLCESGCGAVSTCDEEVPYASIAGVGWCSGTGGCQAVCSSYIRDADDDGDSPGEAADSCGGCDAGSSGYRCDSDFDGAWDGVCAYDGSSWICDSDEVAQDGTLYTDCSLASDGSQCENTIGTDGFTPATIGGLCAGGYCCDILYVDSNNNNARDDNDCTCREEYNGFKCDQGLTGSWNGICAQSNAGAWECETNYAYFDGTNYRSEYHVNYEGYACDADVHSAGFEQDGQTHADASCLASTPPPLSCENGAGADCANSCTATDGFQCTLTVSPLLFTQTGTCTASGCDETGNVCNDDGTYEDDCSSCSLDSTLDSAGDSCDSDATSGGNYVADGLCTVQGCDTDGDACIDADDDLFKDDCSECNAGNLCDSGATTSYTSDGFCAQSNCYVVSSYNHYIDSNNDDLFNDEDSEATQSCASSATRYYKCAVNADHTWDGLCMYYGGTGSCDTTMVTCTLSQDSNFDEPSDCDTSTIASSTIESSTLTQSEIVDSTIRTSVIDNSYISNSEINGSTLGSVTILNSQLCSGISGFGAQISNNVIVTGSLSKDGKNYFAPTRISTVCSGELTTTVGYVAFNVTAASDNQPLGVYYVSSQTGNTVTADMSNFGAGDISLVDDGTGTDETAGDGIYTGGFSPVSTSGYDGYQDVTVSVVAVSDSWDIQGSVLVDNTPLTASLTIYSITGDEFKTATPTVVLESIYNDNLGIDGCRFANELASNLVGLPFTQCKPTSYWSMDGTANGTRRVFMEVRDLAGNTLIVNDTIMFNTSLSNDITPPTRPAVYPTASYTNEDSLTFKWYNSTDQEQVLLFNDLYFEYWLCTGSDCSLASSTTVDQEVTFSNLGLLDNTAYYLRVAAYNVENLYSENATSSSTRTDFTPPSVPTITTEVDPTNWNSGNVVFNFTATDTISGVQGFSTSVSRNSNILPDNVADNNKSISIGALPDGYYTFRVRAIDFAGNVGPIGNYTFRVDNTPPTVPQMRNFEQNATNSSLLTFNWTSSYDVSGIETYHLQIATDSEFTNTMLNTTLNATSYTFAASSGATYFARVRALNGVGFWSLYSSEVSDTIDVTPPTILFKKPSGVIVSQEPTFVVRTDEVALCTYALNGSEDIFDITNLRNNEGKVSLSSDGAYSYVITCTDVFGNQVTDSLDFTVDTSREPDSINIVEETVNQLYADQISLINFTLRDGATGLGEIALSTIDVYFNNELQLLSNGDYSIADLGNGVYQLGLVAANRSSYSVKVMYDELSDSESFSVKDLTLETNCGDYCDYVLSSRENDRQRQKFNIVIRQDSTEIAMERCPDSSTIFSSGDCLKIESLGNGDVCVAFVSECKQDTLTLIVDE